MSHAGRERVLQEDQRDSPRPAATVEGLAIAIGGQEVVTDVTFSVARGECLGIVGESGSGKSVTCRALTGLLPRIGGEVIRGEAYIDGEPVAHAPQARWRALRGRSVALIPQASLAALDPVMRIGKQLTGTIRLVDGECDPRQRAKELLEQVQIHDSQRVSRAYPHQLSGGMRQRVMIALALAARPQLLIADEPTTALDVTIQAGILSLLDELRRSTGVALILVTHDLAVVRSVADQVTVMYGGMTFESGSRRAVLAEPRNPYTRALIAADPGIAARGERLAGLPGMPPTPGAWPPGCRFAPRCPNHEARCDAGLPVIESEDDRSVACVRWRELA